MDNNAARLATRRRMRRKRTRCQNPRRAQAEDDSDSTAETSSSSNPSPKRACEDRSSNYSNTSSEGDGSGSGVESENGQVLDLAGDMDQTGVINAEQQQNGSGLDDSESDRPMSSDVEFHQDGMGDHGHESGNATSDVSDIEEAVPHEDRRASSSDSEGEPGLDRDSEHSNQSEATGRDSESDEDEPFNYDNEPLYDGSPITLKESSLAILSFVLSYTLSGVCINDLLSLISLHCGPNSRAFKSIHLFKKYFSMLGTGHIVRHYFCSVCEVPLETKDTQCNNCEQLNNVSYFIECPIIPQLRVMYKRPGFYESLSFKSTRVKQGEQCYEDVYDGQVYVQETDNGFLSNPDNISFNMYFDGVAIWKSAKFSLWPCFLFINELNYTTRTKKENVLLAGLWFGKSKPNPNLFLQPICEQMDLFKNEGVEFELSNRQVVRVRAKILSAVGDLPAKALFMRMLQYNGMHSCFNCLASGTQLQPDLMRRGSVHVFPYTRNLIPRTKEQMTEFANLAIAAREADPEASVYGVKGPTLLSALLPNVVSGLGIDVMHGIYLGQMRTLLDLWFNSKYSGSAYSICAFTDIVDERLSKIKPPFSYQRVPRRISKELALFKASDLKIFFFYFSVIVLHGILPNLYWDHHCKLVSAISLLCSDSVSPDDIDTASQLLHSYVSEFQNLYGLRYVGLNCHQILHLCEVVRNLGPAWVFACFVYESLNGELRKLVHGTRHSALQICASSTILMRLPVLINGMNEGEAKLLCLRFMNAGKRKVNITEIIDDNSCVVGKLAPCNPLPLHVRNLLRDTFNIDNGRFQYFLRLKKKSNIFTSEMYDRSQKKLSCFAQLLVDGTPQLCRIKYFIRWSSCDQDCPQVCPDCNKIFICIASLYERIPWRIHELGPNIIFKYLDKVSQTNTLCAVTVDSIQFACLYIAIDQDEYMCTPVNSLEIE